MDGPIRVLHVLGRLNMGGAETRIMDLYRHMDREKVQFDFLVHYRLSEEDRRNGAGTDSETLLRLRPAEDFDEEAVSLGARLYVLPRFTGTNLHEYRQACRALFAAHHDWAVAEGHMTSMASVYLPIAKEAGVPVTIAHARSAGVDPGIRGIATRIFRKSLPDRCDIMMSCSRPASISVFGEKAVRSGRILTVPNALDLKAFRFDPEKRMRTREEFGIPENAVVVGHVGRFDPVKNQSFLAQVGAKLREMLPDCAFRFLLVGQGSLQEEVRRAFEEAGLGKELVMAGQQPREKTAALYQAFDVFAFPSLYEGLPGTVIEAQSAGLPCVIADTITEEAAVTGLVTRLPLASPERWAEEIVRRLKPDVSSGNAAVCPGMDAAAPGCPGGETGEAPGTRRQASDDAMRVLSEAGYEIESAAARMQAFYLNPEKGLC